MKKKKQATIWMISILFVMSCLIGCSGCNGEKADDVSTLPGVYTGEATLILPEQLKAMVKADSNGKKLIPDGPVKCKLRVKENQQKNITIEIEEFKMPVKGVEIAAAPCHVTQDKETFFLNGEGSVKYKKNSIDYTHEGSIEKGKMQLTITIPIIPMLVEPQIVFKGQKEN